MISSPTMVYVSGEQPILIDPARTCVIINDNTEPECGKHVNCKDTYCKCLS